VVICALGVLSPAIAAAAATAPAPPAPPANVVVVTGNALAKVSWTEATAKTTFTASAVAAGHVTRTCKVKVDTCTITTLTNGVTYSVSVTATNAKGVTSAASAAATVTIGAPGPPRTVQTTPAKVLVIVKWLAPVATGVAAITGYTATAMPGDFTCLTVSSLLAPAARSCTIVGLTKASTYTITVTAKNRWGTSVPSKVVTVTTR
jgi:hypothetical protein